MVSLKRDDDWPKDWQGSNGDSPSVGHIAEAAVPRGRRSGPPDILSGTLVEENPYLAFAGIFADDPFADEVDAYVAAERQRERDEAAREAGE